MSTQSQGPLLEMAAQLVTGSGFLAALGKGRKFGVARLDPQALTFVDKKGTTVLAQPLRGITATQFKRMTSGITVTGDTTFKIYPPMAGSDDSIGDVIGVAGAVASTYMFHQALREAVALARGEDPA